MATAPANKTARFLLTCFQPTQASSSPLSRVGGSCLSRAEQQRWCPTGDRLASATLGTRLSVPGWSGQL
ncbi:hypothetical protein MHYP_G00338060 [Metynnis hypsauchen]